jgi:bifunctional ADP-heptose synthase (sugar kinase/adenylyltransferase)
VDIPTVAQAVYDVTGAGDTVVSVFTLGVAAGADYETAARLANLAAGIAVSKRGTACIAPEELLAQSELMESKLIRQ